MEIKRGDIFLVNLGETLGSIQGGLRPAIILQNDTGNKYSPTTLICPLTSKQKKKLPTHIDVKKENGLRKDSIALCEQIRVVDKRMLTEKVCTINEEKINEINRGVMISFGLS